MFRKAGRAAVWAGSPWAFALASAAAALWLTAGPLFVHSGTGKFAVSVGAAGEAGPIHGKAFMIDRPESAFAHTPDLELARRTTLILEHTMRQRHAPDDVLRAARDYERTQGVRTRRVLEWASENPSVGDALMLGTLTEDMLRPSDKPVGARVPESR